MLWTKKEKQTPFQQAVNPIRRRWQKATRRWKHWRLYFFLFVTLPLFIASLIVKIVETLVRIKLWETATAIPMEAAASPTGTEPVTALNGQETTATPAPIELERIPLEKAAHR